MKSYTTYLFDFDYTLVDASKGIIFCFKHVLTQHNYNSISDDEIRVTIGQTLESAFTQLTKITEKTVIDSYVQEYISIANKHMTINTYLLPEILTVLKALKNRGAKLGIVSTKFRYRIEEFTHQAFPKGFFDVIIGGEDVTHHKPSPEGILLAINNLNEKKENCLYIGDNIVDAKAAQAISIDFYGVLTGTTQKEELIIYPHTTIADDLSNLLT
ncbi:MAG: HAD-IA family hydrolase [Flavobacteriaceae bacterium]|jgi:phosphoglycolate phosphatase|nr:HAD-IA family hydrolase [Flavobacteriaceae bacterium]